MKIKAQLRYHRAHTDGSYQKKQKTSVGEDVEKLEPLCITGGNVKWCHHRERVWRFLKRLNIELSFNPAILLLSIDKKE